MLTSAEIRPLLTRRRHFFLRSIHATRPFARPCLSKVPFLTIDSGLGTGVRVTTAALTVSTANDLELTVIRRCRHCGRQKLRWNYINTTLLSMSSHPASQCLTHPPQRARTRNEVEAGFLKLRGAQRRWFATQRPRCGDASNCVHYKPPSPLL